MQVSINPHPVDETSDIPSIPELQAELDLTIDRYRSLTYGYRGETAHHIVVARQRLEDARWQLAVESNRWVQRDSVTMWGGERRYWTARQAMQRTKWACRHLAPSTGKELELHPTGDLLTTAKITRATPGRPGHFGRSGYLLAGEGM